MNKVKSVGNSGCYVTHRNIPSIIALYVTTSTHKQGQIHCMGSVVFSLPRPPQGLFAQYLVLDFFTGLLMALILRKWMKQKDKAHRPKIHSVDTLFSNREYNARFACASMVWIQAKDAWLRFHQSKFKAFLYPRPLKCMHESYPSYFKKLQSYQNCSFSMKVSLVLNF